MIGDVKSESFHSLDNRDLKINLKTNEIHIVRRVF